MTHYITIIMNDMTHTTQGLLTPSEAGAILRLKTRTINNLARTGRIPAVKIGGAWRFHPDAISALLAQGLPKSPIASTSTPSAPVEVDGLSGGAADTTGSPSISTPEDPNV